MASIKVKTRKDGNNKATRQTKESKPAQKKKG